MNQPKLPPNQSPAYPTGRRLQMASDGNECAGKPPICLVQLSVKYETVLNMTTAKALGLDVPTSILLSADALMTGSGAITSVRLSKLMSAYPPTSDLYTALPRTVETGPGWVKTTHKLGQEATLARQHSALGHSQRTLPSGPQRRDVAACPIGFHANFLAKVRGKRRTG